MVTHVAAIPTFANRLDVLYGCVAAGHHPRRYPVFPLAAGGGIQIARRSLLPLDFSRFARPSADQPPLTTLAPRVLLERLAAEYVYAELCEAAMHAFAAENEARMMVMTSARTNIEDKLAALSQQERQLRQQEITTEIIELAAGADALRGGRR